MAVTAPTDSHIRVEAGPGSGKTRVLMARVAHLIAAGGMKPQQLMAITFSNLAGKEIKERLEVQLGAIPAGKLKTGTFHSIAAMCLRSNIHRLNKCGRTRDFTINDTEDNVSLVKEWCREQSEMSSGASLPSSSSPDTARQQAIRFKQEAQELLKHISRFKSSVPSAYGFTAHELTKEVLKKPVVMPGLLGLKDDKKVNQEKLTRIEKCMTWYEEQMRACNTLDFDDLISLSNAVLRDRRLAARMSGRYRHILVDEFQDTNAPQYEFVRLLAAAGSKLFAVGDPNQSIYAFRGSDPSKMEIQLSKDCPALKTYQLRDNYRSTPEVLSAAMTLLPLEEPLVPRHSGKSTVQVVSHATGYTEAQWIVKTFLSLHKEGLSWSEMAVLFRTNHLTRLVEQAMVKAAIPYKLLGGTPFWQRQEIKDLSAYLRVIVSMKDVVATRRIINMPSRKLGPKSISKIQKWANSAGKTVPSALFEGCHECHPDLLPSLPSAKDMGLTKSAHASLCIFRLIICTARHFARSHSIEETLDHIIEAVGYKEHVMSGKCGGDNGKIQMTQAGLSSDVEIRWGNVLQMKQAASDFRESYDVSTMELDESAEELAFSLQQQAAPEGLLALQSFVDLGALMGGDFENNAAKGSDTVHLITMHKAKGLEFTAVCVAVMEEGTSPHHNGFIDEEQRLAYVAVTRAKRHLYMSHARSRMTFTSSSRVQSPKRSSFLKNMAPEVASEGHQNPELATSYSDANGDTETYVQDCGSNIPSVSSSDPTSRNGINLSRFENSLSRSSSSSSGGSSTTTYRQYSSTTSKYRGASKMVNTSGEEGTDDIVRSDRGSRGVARG